MPRSAQSVVRALCRTVVPMSMPMADMAVTFGEAMMDGGGKEGGQQGRRNASQIADRVELVPVSHTIVL